MESKVCVKCGSCKPLHEYNKQKRSKDGKTSICKQCESIRNTEKHHSKKGLLSIIYNHQKASSHKRGHRLPEYTKVELTEWAMSQTVYHELFNEWRLSGWDSKLTPSIDRYNDYIHYCFSNIRLVTWKENNKKQHIEKMYGKNNRFNKSIVRLDVNTEVLLDTYYSLSEASRYLDGTENRTSSLSRACKSIGGKYRNFKWMYLEDYNKTLGDKQWTK